MPNFTTKFYSLVPGARLDIRNISSTLFNLKPKQTEGHFTKAEQFKLQTNR